MSDLTRFTFFVNRNVSADLVSYNLVQMAGLYDCVDVYLASRVNKPPVAVVKPASQEVNEPNDLVIDGACMLAYHFELDFNILRGSDGKSLFCEFVR